MSVIGEFVEGVVRSVLTDIVRKATGTRKRARRRKSAATPAERLRRLERLIKPAKKQTSRRKTVRARSQAKRSA